MIELAFRFTAPARILAYPPHRALSNFSVPLDLLRPGRGVVLNS
jgi:hypothetical protein